MLSLAHLTFMHADPIELIALAEIRIVGGEGLSVLLKGERHRASGWRKHPIAQCIVAIEDIAARAAGLKFLHQHQKVGSVSQEIGAAFDEVPNQL